MRATPLFDRGLATPRRKTRRSLYIIAIAISLSFVASSPLWYPSFLEDESSGKVAPLTSEWEFGVYASKHVYSPGEEVNLTVYAKNVDNVSHELWFAALPQVYCSIVAENGTAVNPFNGYFLYMVTSFAVMPNETTEWNFLWPQDMTSGEPVPWPGYYAFYFGNTGSLPDFAPVWVAITDMNHCSAEFDLDPVQPQPGVPAVFNSSESRNAIGGNESLEYRWDWEGDGTWDTDWSSEPVLNHTFVTDGIYAVTLETRDLTGENASVRHLVEVGSPAVPEFETFFFPAAGVVAGFVIVLSRTRKR